MGNNNTGKWTCMGGGLIVAIPHIIILGKVCSLSESSDFWVVFLTYG